MGGLFGDDDYGCAGGGYSNYFATSKPQAVNKTVNYNQIIARQNFSGYWSVADINLLDPYMGKIADEDKSDYMVTLLILQVLTQKFPQLRNEWYLIEAKALKWLRSNQNDSLSQLQQKTSNYQVAEQVKEEEVECDMGGLFGDDDDY